jgi:prophage regulatory protein
MNRKSTVVKTAAGVVTVSPDGKPTPAKTTAGVVTTSSDGHLIRGPPVRLLSFPELRTEKGIRFSRQWIHRLVKAGQFPAPLKLGEATNGFVEAEIDAWIIARIHDRDGAVAA